ncbi:MAG: membrane dipeptidase, partial [Isosphaeraceae bacterium]
AQADPWRTVGELIVRYEAEFSGRMLHGPDDVARWLAEPENDAICWGMLGIEGLDYLVRDASELDRIRTLFDRGVRVFQLVASASSQLAGASVPGDDRGLTELGRSALELLAELALPSDVPRPRPVVDLAGLSERSTAEVLSWFEAEPQRCERVPLVRSRGGMDGSRTFHDNVTRLRALGGLVGLSVGPPFVPSTEALREQIEAMAAVPFQGREGYAGIGIGSRFLELDQGVSQLASAAEVIEWLAATYPAEVASALAQGNARQLLLRAAGRADGM